MGRACISGPGGDPNNLFCSMTGNRHCACPRSTTGEGCLQCAFDANGSTPVMRCTSFPPAAFTQAELGPAFVPGFSVIKRFCRGGRFQDLSRQGCDCRRSVPGSSQLDRTCAVCNVQKVPVGDTFAVVPGEGRQCLRCKLSTYFHLGQCLDASHIQQMESDGLVAYDADGRSYGRAFEPPFACRKSGRMRYKSTTNEICRCKNNADVADCTYGLNSTGQTVSITTKCRRSRYLDGTTCVNGDSCSAAQTKYGDSYTNRVCTAPFVCNQVTGLPAVNSIPCRCPDRTAGLCHWFANNAVSVKRSTSSTVAVTLTCQNNRALFNNTCVDSCPIGTSAMGSQSHTICV